jgi:hypothetical protein
MKTRTMLTIGLSAFALTGVTVGAATVMTANAASVENPKQAAAQADKARKALAKRQADKAVQFAETGGGFDSARAPNIARCWARPICFRAASPPPSQALNESLSLESRQPQASR